MRTLLSRHTTLRSYLSGRFGKLSKDVPLAVRVYVEAVVDESIRLMMARPTWNKSERPIAENIEAVTRGRWSYVETHTPHAYLRQYGLTESGDDRIYAQNAEKLLINNTGLTLDEYYGYSFSELREDFEYGRDYWFTESVRIASNPYLAYPGSADDAQNISDKYNGDTEFYAENALDTAKDYIDTMVASL